VSVGLRIVIASSGPAQFRFLHETLADSGHVPVAYLMSRSMRSSGAPEPDILDAAKAVLADLPAGMDLLLPGRADSVVEMLAGYRPDLLLVFGFNWRLPPEVLELPRFGVLNIHPSALPRYRGPSPVLRAVRNGDPSIGITVHRMCEEIDAGPLLAQAEGILLPDEVTHDDIWQLIKGALPGLLADALGRVADGDPGTPQDEGRATYAGFPPADWHEITWRDGRFRTHNQVRVLRLLNGGQGPMAELRGLRVQVHRTSLEDGEGERVDCADGPLWVTYSDPASG
jgi:methionyl-tRNA formyltransferase